MAASQMLVLMILLITPDKLFNAWQFLLGYKAANTTILAGRQYMNTFFAPVDLVIGTGIKVINTDIPNTALIAYAFDATFVVKENVYGTAIISSIEPIKF